MEAKVNKKVRYPENLSIKEGLRYGDVKKLERKSRYTYRTIHDILNGHRLMPDSLAKEITKLLNERKKIADQLGQAVRQQK